MARARAAPLLLLLLLAAPAGAETPSGVTCSLSEYQDLYHRAVQADLLEGLKAREESQEGQLRQREQELREREEALRGAQQRRQQRERVLPGNWRLVRHSAEGECCSAGESRSLATFNFSLEFRVFEDEWTALPLIDADTIVGRLSVHRAAESGSWTPLELGEEAIATVTEREEGAESRPQHVLAVNGSGLFRAEIQAYGHVQSNRNLHSLALNLLHPLTAARLRLSRDAKSHLKELSTEPAAYLAQTQGDGYTDVEVRLPSSQTLVVKWRMQQGVGAAPAKSEVEQQAKEEDAGNLQAAVVHDSIHSVEDSILQSTHSFKYSLDGEQSLSHVQISFPGAARVTSVVAHGMQTWRTAPSNASGADPPGTTLHVAFKTSVISREVIVMVTTELAFDSGARLLRLPTAVCGGALRQAGTLAVVKVANVEIYEERAAGVARAGVEDVPEHMRSRVGWPIIMAYKFLAPRHNVTLSVSQHEEESTLEAMADAARYQALVLDSQVMHDYLLVLQNTRQQYMEVTGIPASATLWALKVNSVATKPVRTAQNRLLVPLLVGSPGRSGASKASVQLTWLTSQEPLGGNGTLKLHPPGVDMPIAALSAEVFLPEHHELRFGGSMKRVERFSQPQPSPVSYQTEKEVVPDGFDFATAPPPRSSGAGAAGVRAKVPKSGKRHLLEQLLVLPPGAQLTVDYRPAEQPIESWGSFLKTAWR